jgi:group I intron endonuclease
MIIYKITNKLNGKMYVGQTVQKLLDRWSDHCRPCLGRNVNNSAIASAIRKYGKENFTLEQIDSAENLEQLNTMERTYIKALNTLAPNGYNLELGGDSKVCHEETKAKISTTLKGRPIKNRMNGAPKGRPVSAERRARISKTLTGRPNIALYKPVLAVETGIIYESVNAAAKALGVNRVTISALLKSGKQGRLGISFKFA